MNTPGGSTLLEQKRMGRLKESLSEIGRRSSFDTYEFFRQSNLSWLTSIMVSLDGLRKNLLADALSQPTTQAQVCEGCENNFC